MSVASFPALTGPKISRHALFGLKILEHSLVEPKAEAKQLGAHRQRTHAGRRLHFAAHHPGDDQLQGFLRRITVGAKFGFVQLRQNTKQKGAHFDGVLQRLLRRVALADDGRQIRVPSIRWTGNPVALPVLPAKLNPQQGKSRSRKVPKARQCA